MTETDAEKKIRDLMTASPGLTAEEREVLFLTGNEYLSLPEIGRSGEIRSINLLHMGARGLSNSGVPKSNRYWLLSISIDGEELPE